MNLTWTALFVAASVLALSVLLVLTVRGGARKRSLRAVTAVAVLGGTYIIRQSSRERAWSGPRLEFKGQRSRRNAALSEDASTPRSS